MGRKMREDWSYGELANFTHTKQVEEFNIRVLILLRASPHNYSYRDDESILSFNDDEFSESNSKFLKNAIKISSSRLEWRLKYEIRTAKSWTPLLQKLQSTSERLRFIPGFKGTIFIY